MARAGAAITQEASMLIVKSHLKIHGGTPPFPLVVDVGDAIVVWQPDGEVKTLRRKP